MLTQLYHPHPRLNSSPVISLFKSGPHTFADLETKADAADDPRRLKELLYLVRCLYEGYERKLKDEGRIDFADMIAKAAG